MQPRWLHGRCAGQDSDLAHTSDEFQTGTGRLARVGYVSRVIDALFSVALLVRGRVPGDAATAASLGYQALMEQGHRHVYHGRVMEQNGWIVLQYWFFYLYNNWRSGFNGANDHEADWEMVCVYLSNGHDGEVIPEWVAYASHDYAGDDLRRRWDDPELHKAGEHPVIFAGAGSHASYFNPGEYLTEIELNFLAPITRLLNSLTRSWRRLMRETETRDGTPPSSGREDTNVLAIPFVDFARGDGLALGPGQMEEWDDPVLIDESVGWLRNYRGLWGLYTQDPFTGEDAPAGPMYNRNSTVRRSWYDPVGWAGLDKVPPGAELANVADVQAQTIRDRLEELRRLIGEKTMTLRGLDVQAAAMRNQPHLASLYGQTLSKIDVLSHEIGGLQAEMAADKTLLDSLQRYSGQLLDGDIGPPRAHLRRAHRPTGSPPSGAGRLAEVWAAASVTVLLVAFVVLFYFNPNYLPFWLVAIIALFAFIEASIRGTFTRLLGSAATGLAVVAGLVLAYEFFWPLVGLGVLSLAIYILWDNLRELFRPNRPHMPHD